MAFGRVSLRNEVFHKSLLTIRGQMKCNSISKLWENRSRVILVLLLYCTPVVVSGASVLRDNVPSNEETVFQKFLRSNILQNNHNPRVVTVVDGTHDQLDETRPLLHAVPHFIARNGKEICTARDLAADTILMQLLSSLKDEHVTPILEDLLSCQHTDVIFVMKGEVNEVDIVSMLRSAFQNLTKVPILLNYNKTSVKLYGYGVTENDCSNGVTLIMDWVPGVSTVDLVNWQNNHNRETCRVVVYMTHYMPWMMFDENANGEVKIVAGFEGDIISLIAEKLNFNFTVKFFKQLRDSGHYTLEHLVKRAVHSNMSIGIAQLTPDQSIRNFVDVSRMYAGQYLVWCVPRISKWELNMVTSEFSPFTWMLVGLTFLTSFAVQKVLQNFFHSETEKARESDFVGIILNIVGTTLGNSIIYRPLYVGDKLLLLTYLVYSIVITTVYKTSLASLLTAGHSDLSLSNLKEVLAANLTTGGHRFGLEILQEQLNEYEEAAELIKRYEIQTDYRKALRRVSNLKDFAFLTTLSQLSYDSKSLIEAGENISFDVLDKYVITRSPVMIFPRKSRFTRPVDTVTQRLLEAGFIRNLHSKYFGEKLMSLESVRSSGAFKTQHELVRFNRGKYYHVFIIYCVAMIFCISVFLGELVVHEFKSGGRIWRLNNVERHKIRGRSTS